MSALRDALRDALETDGLGLLIQHYGGTRLRVHSQPRPDTDIARALGPEVYGKLQRTFAGEEIDVPTLPRLPTRDLVYALRAEGRTGNQIARAVGLSLRRVRKILSEMVAT